MARAMPPAFAVFQVARTAYHAPARRRGEGHVEETATDRGTISGQADIDEFIARWKASGAAERANYQLYLSELCDVLGVPRPDPAGPDDTENAYVFDRAVTFHDGERVTTKFIDLYKRGCFVLEAKQGSDKKALEAPLGGKPKKLKKGAARRGTGAWDDAMLRARGQAELYAKAVPAEDGWPPLLIVVDVGHSIELFADFSGTGKHYAHFPDSRAFRIFHENLVQRTCANDCGSPGPIRWRWTLRGAPPASPGRSPTGWRFWQSRWKPRAARPRPWPRS